MSNKKQKTRKSAAKRFKVTGSGKVQCRAQGFRHLKSKKNKKWLRRKKKMIKITGVYKAKVLRMLGRK
jgi:large subunit ribosomal protein L35